MWDSIQTHRGEKHKGKNVHFGTFDVLASSCSNSASRRMDEKWSVGSRESVSRWIAWKPDSSTTACTGRYLSLEALQLSAQLFEIQMYMHWKMSLNNQCVICSDVLAQENLKPVDGAVFICTWMGEGGRGRYSWVGFCDTRRLRTTVSKYQFSSLFLPVCIQLLW